MKRYLGLIALFALSGTPAMADQPVGVLLAGTETLNVAASPQGSKWMFSGGPSGTHESFTMSYAQLQAVQRALDAATRMDTSGLPADRAISVSSVNGVAIQVQQDKAASHKIYIRAGSHMLTLDGAGQTHFEGLVSDSLVAQRTQTGQSSSNPGQIQSNSSSANEDQQESDANRLLHHWHGQ